MGPICPSAVRECDAAILFLLRRVLFEWGQVRKGASTLQAGNGCSHGLGRGAGSPLGTDLFSFRQPRQGGVLVGSSELHTPD